VIKKKWEEKTGSQNVITTSIVALKKITGNLFQFHTIYAKSGSFCVFILPGSLRFFHQRKWLLTLI